VNAPSVRDLVRERSAGEPDELDLGALCGERERVELHARAAPEVADDHHRDPPAEERAGHR
jgi:hypothetical protein